MGKLVIVVQYSSNYGGSTISSQLVAQALSESTWSVCMTYGFPGPFVDISREKGYNVNVISHANWLRKSNPLYFVQSLWEEYRAAGKFKKFFRSASCDLIYINSLVSLAPAIAAHSLGIPVLWQIREQFSNVGGEMQCPGRLGRIFVRKTIERLASEVVVVSESVRDNILGERYTGPFEIIPNAVSDRFFEVTADKNGYCQKLGLPSNVPIVGVPGTLRPAKGHSFFLEAVPDILSEEGNCHFAITGDGDSMYKERLVELACSRGVSPRVHFLGTVPTMENFYGACDIVCVPSIAESFGRTVIEAFATRTPVVATRVGGIQETVTDGENGCLVEHGKVDQLVQTIITLLRKPELRTQLADQARRDAEKLYNESVYKQRIRDAVASV